MILGSPSERPTATDVDYRSIREKDRVRYVTTSVFHLATGSLKRKRYIFIGCRSDQRKLLTVSVEFIQGSLHK